MISTLLITCLAFADSKDQEIAALREAVAELELANDALELANSELHTVIAAQEQGIRAYTAAVVSFRDLTAIKDQRLAVETDLRKAAEERGDKLLAINEKQKGKVGNVERIAWASLVVVSVAAGVYGTVAATPVQIQF